MKKEELLELIKETKKLTLLYVEDDEEIASKTINILKKFFDNIIYAKNGEEGFLKYNENHLDLIISDIRMPKLSGIEMVEKIRKINNKIPIIFTTAHQEAEYYQSALDEDVKGYIVKPINIDKLIVLIKKVVDEIVDNYNTIKQTINIIELNKKLINISYKIAIEKQYTQTLKIILESAKELTNADGGTLYLYNENKECLEFVIVINDTLNVQYNKDSSENLNFKSLPLYIDDNLPNNKNISVVSAMEDRLINIRDIYHSSSFNFDGALSFDKTHNYKTTSMLVVPLKTKDNELIGAIQLINKLDFNKNVVNFIKDDEDIIVSMAAHASMVLSNNRLVEDLNNLLNSLVKSIGSALNEKSEYTAKHVDNVALLAKTIAKGIDKNEDIFKDVKYNSDQLEELKFAAWLHDIGKITTPEYIIDKATKLETIHDRIESIKLKFEIIKRDVEIEFYKNNISLDEKEKQILLLKEQIEFIELINKGIKPMSTECSKKLDDINHNLFLTVEDKKESIFTDDEFYNLSIQKGTLTQEEREKINNHVVVSYNMLKELPFPKKYKNVAKIAGSHHKTPNGKGYAHKDILNLQMDVEDKILAVADIFEALSSHDRPYRGPNTLNQIANILVSMVKDGFLDKDVVKVFFQDKLYEEFVKNNFSPEQMDELKINFDDIEYIKK
ncbi:MAG: response regulator [Campylobacterota bacterium]|nr:response regulator [Campylobacterota bacterium]